ncbi:SGNH/GDSL hydrolase family protein [Arsenicicoccus bolidensis]|uniref:SGNH/GDSL hydrolase family protein n=1 Tax=Arsenicicoccus bolidensis TaxID=229480 RepID=UPI0028AA7C0F|nr:SGNH/GDSL hydrolase family protein [Arsenicicoccus bolidensis]
MSRVSGLDVALGAATVAVAVVSAAAFSGWSPRSSGETPSAAPTVAARTATPPAPTASVTSAPTAKAVAPMPRLAADRPATLAVLGDESSNGTNEWVNLVGEQLGEQRRTRVQRIRQTDESVYNAPIRYGDDDPDLTVWNASLAGASPEVTGDRLRRFLPEAPEVVLLSHGRRADGAAVAAQLTRTREALATAYPQAKVVVVLQPPLAAEESSRAPLKAVRDWAVQQGLPTIDVAAAFAKAPASPRLQEPGTDSPLTAEGQALWAATVHRALTAPAPVPSPTATPPPTAATWSATASATAQPSR